MDRAELGANGDTFHHWTRRRREGASCGGYTRRRQGNCRWEGQYRIFHTHGIQTANSPRDYQAARIILHATGNSDYRRPQLTDKAPERNATGEAPTRALSSLISGAIRRKPWTLGIASTQARPLSQLVSKTPSMAPTPLGTDSPLKETERRPAEGGVDVDYENENENENDGIESAPAVGWFGGMTRWASKLWAPKRARGLSTPHTQE